VQNRILFWSVLLFSLLGYIFLSYYTQRSDFFQLIGLFVVLFLGYGLIIKKWSGDYKLLTFISILFRFALLFSIPNLSDDLYRFVWDGRLFANGENPFLHLPEHYVNSDVNIKGITRELYDNLNSPHYFTIYPPLCQYIFWIACKISPESIPGSVLIMKFFIFLSEIGSILLIGKLLQKFKLPKKNVLLYALNPLVIIELTGNLHFEAIMIFFLLLAIYFIIENKFILSAICFGCAVGTKFLPLLFLPLLIRRIGLKRTVYYSLITGSFIAVLFLPFIGKELVTNLSSSLDLYFRKFEFNASIYYVVRWVGYKIYGYNIIAKAGVILSSLTFLFIIWLAIKEKKENWEKLPQSMLFALSIYFILATIVHPWYITTLIALSVFTKFRYAVVWSCFIVLSYITYETEAYHENLLLVLLEYLAVFGWSAYEWRKSSLRVITR